MDGKIVCFCVLLCVAMSSGVPVLQLTPATPEAYQPQHQVLVVKRSAQYDRAFGHLPCASGSYRCPFPDVPAHDTKFIKVNIRK